MSRTTLVRTGGTAAIVGGVLRAAASFAPGVDSNIEQQLLYLAVDIFLLLGLLGFYELRYQDAGRTGAVGFLLAIVGLVVVRSSRAIPGFDLYPVGALIFVGGMIVLCGSAWIARALAVWVPAAFVVSALLGVVGTVADNSGALFVWSGVLFGAAFSGIGREVWLAARRL